MATKRNERGGSLGLDDNEEMQQQQQQQQVLLLLLQVPIHADEETIVLKQMMNSYLHYLNACRLCCAV